MARQQHLIYALALARGATAILDDYVNVNVNVVETVIPKGFNIHVVNHVLAEAPTTTDPALNACVSAGVVLSSCAAAGYLDDAASTASAKACLCCYGGLELVDEYSSCASYVSASLPTETEVYSSMFKPSELLSWSRLVGELTIVPSRLDALRLLRNRYVQRRCRPYDVARYPNNGGGGAGGDRAIARAGRLHFIRQHVLFMLGRARRLRHGQGERHCLMLLVGDPPPYNPFNYDTKR